MIGLVKKKTEHLTGSTCILRKKTYLWGKKAYTDKNATAYLFRKPAE